MSIFSKLFASGHAQANKIADAALDADPVAVLRDQNEKDAQKIHDTQPGMERFRGQVRALERQMNDEDSELKTIQADIDAALQDAARLQNSGDQEGYTQAMADANAKQDEYNTKKAIHDKTTVAYASLKGQFDHAAQDISAANTRIAERNAKAASLGRQIEQSHIVATAVKTAADVTAGLSLSSNDDFANRAEAKAQEIIDANFSAAEVQDIYSGKTANDPAAELNARIEARRKNSVNSQQLEERMKQLGIAKQAQVAQTPVGSAS